MGLTKDDQKIVNVKLNNTPTPQAHPPSVSATSLSGQPIRRNDDVASERVNPKDVRYIEEYGTDSVHSQQNNRKKYR